MTNAAEAASKAGILVEALPFMRAYRGRTVVVKIGGQALDDPDLSRVVAEDIALLVMVGVRVVIVHGGGPQISDAMASSGLDVSFIGGLRVTDEATMELVRRVLVGSINADLVARLGQAGVAAVGISAGDGHVLVGEKTVGPNGEDLGRVGTIASVGTDLLETLLQRDYVPVLSSIAVDDDGGPLNVNADEVASAVARALSATKLVYLTNVEGLYRDLGTADSLVPEVKATELQSMLDRLSDGMKPKAASAVSALGGGVEKVHILDGRLRHALLLEIFTEDGIGTQVLP
ncbi:MAG: acetylglutamate kinase [Actinobacteria bacterium]|nr:acetylglutamate kinase [Actinomycetota bacterium]